MHLIDHGPDEHPLHPGLAVGDQLLGELLARTDGQPVPQDLSGAVNGRLQSIREHTLRFVVVVGDVEPHGGEAIGE